MATDTELKAAADPKKQKEVEDHLRFLVHQYDDYFRHKENLCNAAIAVEIALLASLFLGPDPNWYAHGASASTGPHPIFGWLLAVIPALVLLGFLYVAHVLLLMQLRMRNVADIVADAMRMVVTDWIVKPPSSHALSPVENDDERKGILSDFTGHTTRFNKYLFPSFVGVAVSNTDSLWKSTPRAVLEALRGPLKKSHGSQFEKILAGTSLVLIGLGLVVVAARVLARALML